jgi:monoamine oxidase
METINIIGAGAAGLFAARELSKAGYKIIITEADKRVGGRVHTLSPGNFNLNVETGAEFIHGKLPITFKLLREANIGYERVAGEMYQVKNGHWSKQEEMAPHWDELMKKLHSLDADMTIADFLQQYFSDQKYKDLREQVTRFAEGFDVADTTKASVMAVRDEWQEDMDDTFRITGGYGQLIDYLKNECLAAGCELLTSFKVQTINWKKNDVTVTAADGRVVKANRSIVTVPIGLLQNNSIHFNPSIEKYITAARQIGYGSVIKILFQFKEPFWSEHGDDIGFIFSEETVPTWWTQLPAKNGLLTGWFGGQQVLRVKGAGENEIGSIAIQSLAKTVNKDVKELKKLLIAQEVHDWSINPFSCGAYTYSMLPTVEARKIFREPAGTTIYFAGEGYNEGDSAGTVEAALESASHVIKRLQTS